MRKPRSISFKLGKGEPLVIVQCLINAKGPFDFAIDTGASMTIISPAVARKTGISQTGKRAKAVGAHGRGEVRLARIKSLEIDAISVTNLPVAIMSMATINRASRLHLGGIIGYNFLKRYCLTIDYSTKSLYLKPQAAR